MSDTLRLLLALLDIAPEMEMLLGEQWLRFRDELLVLAGRLQQEGDAAAIGRDLDELLGRLLVEAPPEGQKSVKSAMRKALPAQLAQPVIRRGRATIVAIKPAADKIG